MLIQNYQIRTSEYKELKKKIKKLEHDKIKYENSAINNFEDVEITNK